MKIAYLSDSLLSSGKANAIHVIKMSQALALEGHSVVLYIRAKSSSLDLKSIVSNQYGVIPLFSISAWKIPNFKGSSYLYGLLTGIAAWRSRASIAYCRGLPSYIVAHFLGLSTIVELHQPPEDFCPAWFLYILRRLWAAPRRVRFVVITKSLKYHLQNKFPGLKGLIEVSPDGADVFPANITPIEHRFLDHTFNVGYCGNLYPGKGIELILSLAPRCPWARFHIVGGSERDIDQWKSISASMLNVVWHGLVPHSEVAKYLKSFDVALLPLQKKVSTSSSKHVDIAPWTSPLKLFEYMAASLPIVSSDLPVLREILRHDVNCLFCAPSDVDSWKTQLIRLRDDKHLRDRIGNRANNDFLSCYSWRSRAKNILPNR